ncbi:hypothetical protein, partial [Brevibacillus parabrevis]
VLTVYSVGMGTAALKGGKSVAKLDVDAPHCKQPHADMDADGGKGRGGLLHRSGVDDLLEGTPLKDGKLKTKAKLFDDVLKDFDLLTEKYQHNMLKQIFEKIRIKEEVMVDPVFGQSFSVWNISFFKDKKDGHGLQHIETSKGHVSEAPRNKDIPHEITPPKGGKASGDSGHSHHDEPVTDKKGNDANKNQPHEKEKAGAEGMGNAKYDYKKVEEVENRIRHESKEHGQFFDKDGNLIGDTVIGTEKAIDVSDYRDRGKDAVFTHNHPTNGPFSLEDMMVAVDFDMLEMRAITPNGKTFSMTRGIDGWKVDGQSVRMVYRLVQEELRADVNFNKLYKEGRMDEAWDMFYDKVAERIGGEYKRK